ELSVDNLTLSFYGSGKNTLIEKYTISDSSDVSLNNLKLINGVVSCNDAEFIDCIFTRGSIMKVSKNCTLLFTRCKFEKDFVIEIEYGEHSFIMKECISLSTNRLIVNNGFVKVMLSSCI